MQILLQLPGVDTTSVVDLPPNTSVERLLEEAKLIYPFLQGHHIQLADNGRKGKDPVFCSQRHCECECSRTPSDLTVAHVSHNSTPVTILLCPCDSALRNSIPLLAPPLRRTVRTQDLEGKMKFLLDHLRQGLSFGQIETRTSDWQIPLRRKWFRCKSKKLQIAAIKYLAPPANQPPVAAACRRKRPASVLETESGSQGQQTCSKLQKNMGEMSTPFNGLSVDNNLGSDGSEPFGNEPDDFYSNLLVAQPLDGVYSECLPPQSSSSRNSAADSAVAFNDESPSLQDGSALARHGVDPAIAAQCWARWTENSLQTPAHRQHPTARDATASTNHDPISQLELQMQMLHDANLFTVSWPVDPFDV